FSTAAAATTTPTIATTPTTTTVPLSACADADGDGTPDIVDRCPGTPAAEPVDDAGCSQVQFCAKFDATTRDGAHACKRADWKNDEPLMKLPAEADCVVDKRGPGAEDNRCVPALG